MLICQISYDFILCFFKLLTKLGENDTITKIGHGEKYDR